MKLIWKYMREHLRRISVGMSIKLLGTLGELSLPYILEHIIDRVVPLGQIRLVVYWGILMIIMSVLTRFFNVTANRMAVAVSKDSIFKLRHDLFEKTANLSGSRFDAFGLPSLTSRMTSDSYNVQNFMTRMQTMGVRGPIMLIGGLILTLAMDVRLAMIMVVTVPILMAGVMAVSIKGTPLYDKVQQALDDVVRIMRENITGIRVVKALSREQYEIRRYAEANEEFTKKDIHASAIMAIPGPFMQLCLNVGLTIVIIVGARLVNAGVTRPGVILAFLTYFNLILMAVMGLNRIFIMYSKAAASADRIALVLADEPDMPVMPLKETEGHTETGSKIVFDHVSFTYDRQGRYTLAPASADARADDFAGGKREKCLEDISFTVEKGGTLGIIGATGSGKTSIISLLMRFYDADEGRILIDGRDVRSYEKDDLHKKFGVVFQNDTIFADTLENNIDFGRGLGEEAIQKAIQAAGARNFIEEKEGGLQHKAEIKGANLSGGQRQRLLIARAIAADPEILILDDASSALDYRTDANVRKAIAREYPDVTMIMIAQRISSVRGLDHIIVMEDGKMAAYGTHEELMKSCAEYREIAVSQMGDLG